MWLTGLVAPRHVGSSQTRAQTRVPCIGRQILNYCATREALSIAFLEALYSLYEPVFSDKVDCGYGFSIKIANIIEILPFVGHYIKQFVFYLTPQKAYGAGLMLPSLSG